MTLIAWVRVGVQRTLGAMIDQLAPLAAARLAEFAASRSVEVGVAGAVTAGLVASGASLANRLSEVGESTSVGLVRAI
jgi:hypothetical protein